MDVLGAAYVDPTTTLPARRPSSTRRTSHVDIIPTRTTDGRRTTELRGRARDLSTAADGSATVLAEASIQAEVDDHRRVVRLEVTPDAPGAATLVGAAAATGFRKLVEQAVPEHHAGRTPLFLLLDDLPVTAMLSGYAGQFEPDRATGGGSGHMADICSGFRRDGFMLRTAAATGQLPLSMGPAAPTLEPDDDPWAWHGHQDLPPGALRRRRLVDVVAGDPWAVVAMFRDTYVDLATGVETVLHEYSAGMDVDPATGEVLRSEARPQVLPWEECPAAAASATRLVGTRVADVRDKVRLDLRGTTTCTHLNDLLRSLADVQHLGGLLP